MNNLSIPEDVPYLWYSVNTDETYPNSAVDGGPQSWTYKDDLIPLYTRPSYRPPLTVGQLFGVFAKICEEKIDTAERFILFAREIEKLHGISGGETK